MRTVPDGGTCETCIGNASIEIEASSESPYSENKEYYVCEECADKLIDELRSDGYTVYANGERCDREDA